MPKKMKKTSYCVLFSTQTRTPLWELYWMIGTVPYYEKLTFHYLDLILLVCFLYFILPCIEQVGQHAYQVIWFTTKDVTLWVMNLFEIVLWKYKSWSWLLRDKLYGNVGENTIKMNLEPITKPWEATKFYVVW